MLALKSERNERENEMQGFSTDESKFVDGGDLLDNIDFDDLFSDDVLPDLEILAELSCSESENNSVKSENVAPVSDSDVRLESPGQEIVSKTKGPEPESKPSTKTPASKETGKSGKNQPGKKKAKVDWTPELHRRFVTAVEQLGIDKAVPSRILEIMGNDRLTRHNIASHLQKYRAHQKHLQARGAEAASWSRRRQTYGTAAAGVVAAATGWIAPNPTLGFPHFRPLHVWGHPFVDQSLMYTWPKHIASPPPAPPLADLSFWHPHHQYQYIFPQPPASHVAAAQTPSNVHPSKESIDAAIEDVIRKPWLPLPLGLKPPSMDGVMVELKRRGVSKIPPPP